MFSKFLRKNVPKDSSKLIKTALTQFHIDHGGNMVSYAGSSFPDNYKVGAVNEHLSCRKDCCLFDESYMGQYLITGSDREEFIKNLMPLSFPYQPDNTLQHSLFTNEKGGIIDYCTIATRTDNSLYLVVNGTCLKKDNEHLLEQLETFKSYEKNVDMTLLKGFSLLSLQGPKSSDILNKICRSSITKLPHMNTMQNTIDKIQVWISRSGFTNEDGFQITIEKPEDAIRIAQILSEQKDVHLAGLKARNSLRIESGLPQYGFELNEETTPVEAGLEDLISRDRKDGFPPFFGGKKILAEYKDHSKARDRRLSGILFDSDEAVPKEGCKVFDQSGQKEIGKVTSGVISPVLKKGIALAYVKTIYAKSAGKERVTVDVDNKKYSATIAKLPFVPENYYKG